MWVVNMNGKPKTLYHGTQKQIKDGVIHPMPAHRNNMKTEVTAVFATSDFVHAKNYACMRLIASGWKSPATSDTLYIQRLNPDISGKKAYVYELDSTGFEQDVDGSYYSLADKPIKKETTIDVMQEIQEGRIKVYVLKPGLECPPDRGDIWAELVKNKDNFELYKPNINMSMEEKIKSIMVQMHTMFHDAIGPRTRPEYMKEYGISDRNWHFSLSAEDIIKDKNPANVVGCTGRAQLFCKLAADKGIKSFVVCTAKYADWKATHDGKANHMNGHQIIAVEIDGEKRVFDPGRKELVFIDTELKSGEFIDAIGNGKKDYIVTAVVPGDEFAKMNTYQQLSNLYSSGDMNNSDFTIRPQKINIFNNGKRLVINRFKNIINRLVHGRENK